MSNNEKVMALIKERLDIGAKSYGNEIPLAGEEGRDNLKESLDEALDLAVYLSATILELMAKRDTPKNNRMTLDEGKQEVMIRALNDYGGEAYLEGMTSTSEVAFDLVKELKDRGVCEKCD